MQIESEAEALEILNDTGCNRLQREAAGRYLEHHPRERLIPRLVQALCDDDEGVRRAAAEGLIRLGVTAWPDLLLALMDAKTAGDPRLRRGAHHILHRPFAAGLTAPLLRELSGIPTSDISAMLEADRLYWRMLSNKTFAQRVAVIRQSSSAVPLGAHPGKSIELPLNAEVSCTDGPAGKSRLVVVDPARQEVTHFVLELREAPFQQRLVPLQLVLLSTPQLIQLSCTRQELSQLKPYEEDTYVQPMLSYLSYMPGDYALWPILPTLPEVSIPQEHFHLPSGRLGVWRGARVQALDGEVGAVDEFLVDPGTGHISELVLREGHVWNQKEVTVPVEQIDHIADNTVYLKVDRHSLQALPARH